MLSTSSSPKRPSTSSPSKRNTILTRPTTSPTRRSSPTNQSPSRHTPIKYTSPYAKVKQQVIHNDLLTDPSKPKLLGQLLEFIKREKWMLGSAYVLVRVY